MPAKTTMRLLYSGQLVVGIRDNHGKLYTITLSLEDTAKLKQLLHPVQITPMKKRPGCE